MKKQRNFEDVLNLIFYREFRDIRRRRRELFPQSAKTQKPWGKVERSVNNEIVGLAMSGGGVRSAAFCMGALQGMAGAGLIDRIDYLSTVSGGGYVGTAMTIAMSSDGAKFPFAKDENVDGETDHTQHIRDNSRYLLPKGLKSLPSGVAVYLRGLAASAIIVMPIVLLAAALTIFLFPNLCDLEAHASGTAPYLAELSAFFGGTGYPLTWLFAMIVAAGFLAQSAMAGRLRDFQSVAVRATGVAVFFVLLVFLLEAQPHFLVAKFIAPNAPSDGSLIEELISAMKLYSSVVGVALPILIPLLRFFTRTAVAGRDESFSQRAAKLLSKVTLYLIAGVVPLGIWTIYLSLSFWGIAKAGVPIWEYSQAPTLFRNLFETLEPYLRPESSPAFWAYSLVAASFFIVWIWIDVNANSLLAFYKRRLSSAFFYGTEKPPGDLKRPFRLSMMNPKSAPYHLINTTLNVPGSETANKRGRNGDFFILSRNFVGSEVTGYRATKAIETAWKGDIGDAMAISGAAAAPNMGFASLRPLAFTLALLNVRLGYWFPNPARLDKLETNEEGAWPGPWYFLKEAFFLTAENADFVLLSDGGHIDNLGVYELLRRRAAVIIAVDAEADPDMTFRSLVQVQRFARIDQRIRIRLPWGQIKSQMKLTNEEISAGVARTKNEGPHAAIGIIEYPRDHDNAPMQYGILLYIKASLSGDENDYVIDYKRRNSAFPHETTLDQFFTEEQFEVYRALGFHIANRLFSEQDSCAIVDFENSEESRAYAAARRLLNGIRFRSC
jgi:predicted acylesterase/phospholipase RssA